MNIFCYQHHINDWRTKTIELTMEEKGVYREMMDWFYALDGKLPSDIDRLCKILGVRTQSERTAIASITNTFWTKKEDGYLTQTRCGEELKKIKIKSEKASASAKSRYNKDLVSANAERTQSERTANQEPRTKNQEPYINPPIIPLAEKNGNTKKINSPNKPKIKIVLPSWLPADVWNNFVAHRKAIKSPMTDNAQALSINELERFKTAGHDPVEIVNRSIMRGWKGLFVPDDKKTYQNTGKNQPRKENYSDMLMRASANAIANVERKSNDEIY